MKKILPLAIIVAAFISLQASAQNGPPPGEAPDFSQMDINGDGEIQQDELRGPLADHFSELDKDGSGGLSEEEIPPPPPQQGRQQSNDQ